MSTGSLVIGRVRDDSLIVLLKKSVYQMLFGDCPACCQILVNRFLKVANGEVVELGAVSRADGPVEPVVATIPVLVASQNSGNPCRRWRSERAKGSRFKAGLTVRMLHLSSANCTGRR